MRKILRRPLAILLTLTACLFMAAPAAEAQMAKGEKSFGPFAGYASKNESAVAGVQFQYAFSDHFRLAPDLGYVFRHQNLDALVLDLNAIVPFTFTGERAALYPYAGLAFRSWNPHDVDFPVGSDNKQFGNPADISTRESRFGVNVGAGFEMRLTPAMKLSFEAGYAIIKDFGCTRVIASLAYVF